MAFSKELEDVIEAALADGVITEKERAVLRKKALLEGVDPDEVDVVIDGRLQQKYNEVEAAKQKIRKCPACNEIIPAMTAVCPNCGQVIDTSNPDNKALKEYMAKLENGLIDLKNGYTSSAKLESLIRQGKAMYGDNKKINSLISEIEASIPKAKRAAIIEDIKSWCITGLIFVIIIFGISKCVSSCRSGSWSSISAAIEDNDPKELKIQVSDASKSTIENHEAEIGVYLRRLVKSGKKQEAEDIAKICDGKSPYEIDVSQYLYE